MKATIKTGKKVLDLTSDTGGDYNDMVRESLLEDQLDPHKTQSFGKDLLIYRMPDFGVAVNELDGVMDKARDYSGLILDLRGNRGGAVEKLEMLAGRLLGAEVVLAERKGRKQEKPIQAKPVKGRNVDTKMVILVDSDSASASEILARAAQLEGRGKVIGDRTSGGVRQSVQYSEQIGHDRIVPFGVSVTNADLVMKDGKALEHLGVTPDEVVLPTGEDLAARRDPVLSRAAAILGFELTPEKAGTLFPVKWAQ